MRGFTKRLPGAARGDQEEAVIAIKVTRADTDHGLHDHVSQQMKPEAAQVMLAAADVYAEPDKPSTGCLLVGTALPGCAQNEQLRNALSGFIASLDADLEKLIAERFGADVRALGKTARELSLLISGLLFSLAVRARTGVTRRKLRKAALELAVILT